ncbi:Xanthine dehydrogenase-like Protein [Tribolium castaneum]|uniref:xanthine dehydrogenase n=1 Tax=Tribolium castaneum TaxID=7070 RepID=D6X1R6_TRICA|nr:Xanthine dehydrogenase-like Protein [Tribolium castaneum]
MSQESSVNVLVFFVNGKKIIDNQVDPEWTLLYYLRISVSFDDDKWGVRLCGTKLGCGEGGCGACTVMVSKYDRINKKVIHLPVNACLAPVCSVHGQAVTTVEGIGSTRTRLHPVQERIAKAHGSQCGFCTPGIVMSMYTLLRNSPKPTMNDMEIAFQGNLCRCTGYRPIIEGYKTFTEEWELMQANSKLNEGTGCGGGNGCCQDNPTRQESVSECSDTGSDNGYGNENGSDNGYDSDDSCEKESASGEMDNGSGEVNGGGTTKPNGCAMGSKCCKLQQEDTDEKDPDEEVLFKTSEFTPYDCTQEPIFPPELKLSDEYDRQYLVIKGKAVTWYRPTKLCDLLQLRKQHPNAKIVVGNTEVGVEVKFKHMVYPVIVQPVLIPELSRIENTEEGVRVGASVTLMDVQGYLLDEMKRLPEEKTRVFRTITKMLNWFAGKQIRSVGALGSNIMTGSPISDMLPILMANEVVLELQSADGGVRKVRLDSHFFTGYRKTIVLPDEILLAIHIPYTHRDRYCYAYKQARRREDDIAIVNAAVNVTFEPQTDIISDINIAFGGVSFKTVTALKTRTNLKGLPWNRQTLERAFDYLQEDLPLDPGAPGGMIQYRRSLTLSLFFKAFLAISLELQKYVPHVTVDQRDLSGIEGFHEKEYKSSQYFTVVPHTQQKTDALQRPIVHMSAYKQATGEAIYLDDIPYFENELYLAFVTSTKAHAKILSIDPSEALEMEGVHYFVSAKDIDKKHNTMGSIVHDERVFYNEKVTSQGQIIGGVVAVDQSTAQSAARKVKVVYEDIEPVIVTIPDAIKYNSYHGNGRHKLIVKGDIEKVLREAPHVLESECQMGGQEHFYLETQCVLAVPKKEDCEMEIYSSTQNPTEVAAMLAEVLGIQQNKIAAKVKRLGGGFGGKESKAMMVAIPVAIAAVKLNRPIRCMLDRDEDIVMTGGRHPFLMKYKVAFDDNGKILGADIKLYNNCGYSTDLSPSVLERAMTHFENSYKIPVVRVEGFMCKTNLPSNTAFRGFGGPQGMYAAECILQDVADYLQKDPVTLSELNLYKEGDFTHYNQKLVNCTLDKCWHECIQSSNYHEKRKEVERFNRENRYKKRGLSVIPTKYGIAFTAPHLNQAGCLLIVYADGSVLLSHGGIEMGQGLYTKMIQVASRMLEIPVDKIHTVETATDKVPNTSPTAASSGSDLNGMAVMEACKVIKERLRPFKEANPKGTWEQWVRKAYFSRVSLSATGFYKTPDIGYNWETGEGNMFNYFTYGVACCEVEIDTLTGDHEVRRIDIVMDLGESLNPAIDIGQIEGAFMQGYGLFVLEELVYSPTGTNYTRGPGTYKLPGFGDIPGEFNVSLLKGVSNPRAVFSSKAVGEPPLFLGSSVLYAIKDAIKAARRENGYEPTKFRLDSPATAARIRMACQDNITSKFKDPEPGSFKPWNVYV